MAHGQAPEEGLRGHRPRPRSIASAEAVKLIKERAKAKFDETIEVAMNLDIDPRKSDQNVRGMVHAAARHRQDAARRRLRQGRQGRGGARPPAPTSSAPRIWPRRSRPGRSISTAASPRPT